MKRYLVGLVALPMLMGSNPTRAMTGDELLDWCGSSDQFGRGYCLGVINTFASAYRSGRRDGALRVLFEYRIEGLEFYYRATKLEIGESAAFTQGDFDATKAFRKKTALYCPPTDHTEQHARDIAVRYLESHDQIRHKEISDLLPDAFKEAWPCKEE